jgi:hypothetical protein
MKKASMELSVNFLVVMILSIVLIGVGIAIMMQGQKATTNFQDKVSAEQQRQIQQALDDGSLVFVYPTKGTINRGEYFVFSLGMRNELDSEEGKISFCFEVSSDITNREIGNIRDPDIYYYYKNKPLVIKSNDQIFTPIRIIIPKDFKRGSYLFNVDVKANCDSAGDGSDASKYGDRQKLQINVN